MAKQKLYWDAYADHCIRHPNNHVSYITFRQRVKNRGERLAIRLGKQESAVKMDTIYREKRNGFLLQKKAWNEKQKKLKIARILIGAILFGLGVLLGTML